MAAMEPMALFGLEVPAGDVAITARGDIPAAFRITMAAIDPSAEPEGEDGAKPRATLKIIRQDLYDEDEDDDEDFDIDEMERILGEEYDDDDDEDEDEDDDEELNGGPSDPAKSKKARKEAALKEIMQLAEAEDDDDDDVPNGVNGLKKSAKSLGKRPAGVDDEDDEDDEDDDDDSFDDFEEFVICTLDPEKNYQQPLDITIGEHERVLFKVSGTHSIFLTGNYVEPTGRPGFDDYDEDDEDEDEYDLEPDSDEELDYDDEEDELDDIDDPRIMEIDDEDDEAPALVKTKADKKGKNKRPAEDDEDANGLDALISKAKKEEAANGEKLSKKQLKKQKKNDGSATVTAEGENGSAKSDKKVQFAKQLEQGPTPTKDSKDNSKAALGVKKVQGVTIDDKKLGTGPAAKAGDRLSMRYIGKLEKNNKVFDSNKKGKPFTFKLGSGEVIKGWDIGLAGMSVGGERRITIPSHLAYGSKGAGADIPGNSTLIFDVKLLDISRK